MVRLVQGVYCFLEIVDTLRRRQVLKVIYVCLIHLLAMHQRKTQMAILVIYIPKRSPTDVDLVANERPPCVVYVVTSDIITDH